MIMLLPVLGWAQQEGNQPIQQQASSQQAQMYWGAKLYDDFNHRWLDPAKWAAVPDEAGPNYKEACYFSSNVLECVREIQDGRLRLEVACYGARDSDQGTQYGESKLLLTPQSLKSLTADVTVRRTDVAACLENPGPYFAAPQAMLTASFFHTDSGDVGIDLTFQPISPDNLQTIVVRGFGFAPGGQYFGFVDLDSVPRGTPLRGTVRWDQPNHKFVVAFQNLITHQFFSADVPYDPVALPDAVPAVAGWKGLYVQAFPSNCTKQQTWQQMEATFDNVSITH
ncbi:MAG TPA: hypothetical protein VK466_08770 [Terriglobales bacterium]|nr:hypothetical protein [Terriglobales bacterium]